MQKDTAKLLRECSQGVKMGERAINLALAHTSGGELKEILENASEAHAILGDEIKKMLFSAKVEDKEPSPLVQMMSDAKIKAHLVVNNTQANVASLMTDGCNMGAKSISHYLNKCRLASVSSQLLAHRIVKSEDELRDKLRKFL